MDLQPEIKNTHTILSYTDTQICVGEQWYDQSVIISKERIIDSWPIQTLDQLEGALLEMLLNEAPEVIIIGHERRGTIIPLSTLQTLSKNRIGIEHMSIGAACRTFNVLLNEQRRVVAGFIQNQLTPVGGPRKH